MKSKMRILRGGGYLSSQRGVNVTRMLWNTNPPLQLYHVIYNSWLLVLAYYAAATLKIKHNIIYYLTLLSLTVIPLNCSGLLCPLSPDNTRARLPLSAINRRRARKGPIGKIIEALPLLLLIYHHSENKEGKQKGERRMSGWKGFKGGEMFMSCKAKIAARTNQWPKTDDHTDLIFTYIVNPLMV